MSLFFGISGLLLRRDRLLSPDYMKRKAVGLMTPYFFVLVD